MILLNIFRVPLTFDLNIPLYLMIDSFHDCQSTLTKIHVMSGSGCNSQPSPKYPDLILVPCNSETGISVRCDTTFLYIATKCVFYIMLEKCDFDGLVPIESEVLRNFSDFVVFQIHSLSVVLGPRLLFIPVRHEYYLVINQSLYKYQSAHLYSISFQLSYTFIISQIIMQIEKEDIDTYRRPLFTSKSELIDLEECEKHFTTTSPGHTKQSSPVCPCCNNPCMKQPIPFWFSATDISYLGSGLPLYFSFIHLCILLALISTCIVSIPSLYFNVTSRSCSLQSSILNCSSTIFLGLSAANKMGQDDLLRLQSYLINANILVILMVIQIGRKKMRDLQAEIYLQPEPSDYAVMLRLNEGEKYYKERDVKSGIEEWFQTQNQSTKSRLLFKCKDEFPIQKVIISYDLTTFQALEKQLLQLTQQIKSAYASSGGSNLANKLTRIETIRQLIANKSFARNSKCIVIFRYPQQRHYLFQTLGWCTDSITVNGKSAKVSRVPMPGEILWGNHHYKKQRKFWMRVLIQAATILAIFFGEAIVFLMLYIWFKYIRGDTSTDTYISPLISLLISLINTLLYQLLSHLTLYEYRPTTLEQMVSIVSKVTFSVFLNSGVMLLFAYFMLDLGSIWIYNGFVDTISYSFLFAIVLPHVYKYCGWGLVKGWYGRWRLRREGGQGKVEVTGVTQLQANSVFEKTYDKLHEKYSWVLHQFWWAALFCPLVPIAYPCILLSLLLHLLTQKLNFLFIFRQPKPFGNFLNLRMLSLLQLSLPLMGLGNLILDIIINKLSQTVIQDAVLGADLASIAIGFTVVFLPTEWISKITTFCCIKQRMFLNLEYSTVCGKFVTTYQKEHPLYRYDARSGQRVIQENMEVEMETLAQELQATLKKTTSMVKHPLQSGGLEDTKDQTVMYSSNNYPRKIHHQQTRKTSKTMMIPNLGLSTPKLAGVAPPIKAESDRVVQFKDIVAGMDTRQKQMLLSKFKNSVKTLNKR